MKKEQQLQTPHLSRQYMLSSDFEIYYFSDLPTHTSAYHKHDYYEFYFFLEGNVSLEVENKEYPLNYGDVVFLPPKCPHRSIIHNQEQGYRRIVFWISEEYFDFLLQSSESYGFFLDYVEKTKCHKLSHDLIAFHAIQNKIFQLIEEQQENRFGKEISVTLCARELLLQINRSAYEQTHIQNQKQGLYESLLLFLEEHLDEDLTLDRLSKEFYLSKYHIEHLFKAQMGISLHQYITKKRLAACRASILAGVEINQVYLQYGFREYSVFYRAFKKEYGISPKQCKLT